MKCLVQHAPFVQLHLAVFMQPVKQENTYVSCYCDIYNFFVTTSPSLHVAHHDFATSATRVSFHSGGSHSKSTLSCKLTSLSQLVSIFNYTSILVHPNGKKIVSQ